MTNPTQEIPAEELARIEEEANHNAQDMYYAHGQEGNGYSFKHLEQAYIEGAKSEYLRARQFKQLSTEDQRSFTQSILDILKQHIKIGGAPSAGMYISGLKESAKHLFLFVGGTIDAVYEGAHEWEEKYKDAIARQQAQGETVCLWVKASERLPDDHITHAARFIGTSGYEYTSLTIEDMDVFIGEESHYMIRNFPKGLLKSLEWLEEVSALAQYTSDSQDDGSKKYQEWLDKPSITEDIPVPGDIKDWIKEEKKYLKEPDLMVAFTSGAMSMYQKLMQKMPQTENPQASYWFEKARQNLVERNDFKGRLSAKEQECEDYRKALEEIKAYRSELLLFTEAAEHLIEMKEKNADKGPMTNAWNIISTCINRCKKFFEEHKYPSPPTK